ncbi:MAG: hypothetical protein ACRDL6_02195 [Solirubrobacterales bacterium]
MVLCGLFAVFATLNALEGDSFWLSFDTLIAIAAGWFALYLLQLLRGLRTAQQLIGPASPVAICAGVIAPRRVWVGRAAVLMATSQELLVLSLDLLRITPILRCRLAEIDELDATPRRRSSLLKLGCGPDHLELNTSRDEAEWLIRSVKSEAVDVA